jgi:hypothetical protein
MVGGESHANMENAHDSVNRLGSEHAQHTWGAPALKYFRILSVTHSCPVPSPNLAFFITPLKLNAASSISGY